MLPLNGTLLAGESDGQVQIGAPKLGAFSPLVRVGALLGPGDPIGSLQVLQQTFSICVPAGVGTLRVRQIHAGSRGTPVMFGTPLVELTGADVGEGEAALVQHSGVAGLDLPEGAQVFSATVEGQFYRAPSPSEPNFIDEGTLISPGDVVGLVEVMKFFYEVKFEGVGATGPARVIRVLANDAQAVEAGDPLFFFEPA